MHVLILYGTTEGHTRKIAYRAGEWLRDSGHSARVVDSADVPPDLDLSEFQAAIVAGSLHQTKHQKPLRHFVSDHAAELSRLPTLFLSVSLTAVHTDEEHLAEARECIADFVEETGWTPTESIPVAGALLYTKYDWLRRYLMRKISESNGGDVDTSRDFEYTDWAKLKESLDEFLARAESKVASSASAG